MEPAWWQRLATASRSLAVKALLIQRKRSRAFPS